MNPTTKTICVTALLCAAGCAPRPQAAFHHSGEAGIHLYIGLDTSGSARPQLSSYALLAGQLAARLHTDEDRLTLYRVDRVTDPFSDGRAAGSQEAAVADIVANVRSRAAGPCTYPAEFWEAVARRTAESGQASVVCFFTDGDNDDQTARAERRIRAAARRLAANPRVRSVIVCGVIHQNWSALQRDFSPLGERRMHIFSPNELEIGAVSEAAFGELR